MTKRNSTSKEMDPSYMTLPRFIIEEERKLPEATGEFSQLLTSIQTAAKITSLAIRKGGSTDLFGQGSKSTLNKEDLVKVDKLANEIFINFLRTSNSVGLILSEEEEKPVEMCGEKRGKYIVCIDPCDGTSNIECMLPVGTIFGIFKNECDTKPTEQDALKPASKMVGAGYCLYGNSTILVISTGQGVNSFVLDPSIGEFILYHQDIQIPEQGKIYSINEGYEAKWDQGVKEYVESKKSCKPYSLRYVGSCVADVHRTLLYGGIFLFPVEQSSGMLRLLFELGPLAFLINQAGGLATDGKTPILDITPTKTKETCPVFMGSKKDVEECMEYVKKYAKSDCKAKAK